ncbi:conserved unknown protein [Ectocarpus siliculosus]|uniref:Uncharacterized protein n=1 Tax=Ectocarpus siliculosus TaxID=2880 RepID=D8LF50_ECTSI|nr:conserved unknown protein [Ectocarpus siliculosus]|eukprot:CBN78648.1 conserved unknown protein [Ectocarpus siliculosus]
MLSEASKDAFTKLECLSFSDAVERSGDRFDGVTLPRGLKSVVFGRWCYQHVDKVLWAASLKQITFGNTFNRSIKRIVWPTSLERVVFGWNFNQPVEGVHWPASLRQLNLGECFNHPVEEVAWPSSLEEIVFPGSFDQPITRVKWPASLRHLKFGSGFNQPIHQRVTGWDTAVGPATAIDGARNKRRGEYTVSRPASARVNVRSTMMIEGQRVDAARILHSIASPPDRRVSKHPTELLVIKYPDILAHALLV